MPLVSFLYKFQKVLHILTTDQVNNSLLYLPYPVSIIFVQVPKGAAYSDYRPREQPSSLPSLSSYYHFCTRSKRVLPISTTDPASNRPLYLPYSVSIIFVQDPKGAAYSDYRPREQQSSMPSLLFTFPILLVSFLYKIKKVLHTLTTDPASNSLLYLLSSIPSLSC